MSTVDYINMFVEYLTRLITVIKEFFAGLKGDDNANDQA